MPYTTVQYRGHELDIEYRIRYGEIEWHICYPNQEEQQLWHTANEEGWPDEDMILQQIWASAESYHYNYEYDY